jgi:hypothetical protein
MSKGVKKNNIELKNNNNNLGNFVNFVYLKLLII